MQNLRIAPHHDSIHKVQGWRVAYSISVDSDSPIETFYHFALFADRRDAEDLLAQMRRAGFDKLDLRAHWTWSVDASQVTGLAICAETPTAVLETTPRPSTRRDLEEK